ncbi:MAG TPA: type II 3-dehydroquinate dehydratase [Cytophagales bacterium]|nr:type II 3-dehydroquinate dehydratase [Cytophagales bacterium]HAA19856.1 type II 3-dehydroquinate dehydratase [Cytophagales bacterium]HAP65339.1 type II 3-dehydroquinate dehydratase [Cytophagales bacterium]
MKIIIINGPNLNLLGTREPEIYGKQTFQAYFETLQGQYPQLNLEYYQNNSEGALIDKLHQVGFSYDGIILNGGAYTHTSVAIGDALAAINTPTVEVHISNVYARESFRHHSYFSAHCAGIIVGMGLTGYELALNYFTKQG